MSFRYVIGILLAVSAGGLAWADHEPQGYSYSGAASRVQSVRFAPSPTPRPFAQDRRGSDEEIKKKLDSLLGGLLSPGLAAIAIQDDQILYERYAKGEDTNLYPAWSMTKSLVSLSVGHALCQGHIKSLDDPAQRYVVDVANTVWGRATLRQLLQMRSGSPRQDLDRGGDYLYAGTSSGLDMVNGQLPVRQGMRRFNTKGNSAAAGERFAYANMDTDTLGLVVAAATGKPFHQFFQSSVLAAARLEHPSVFHLDSEGHAVTHAYFFASLRDMARLGRYVVDVAQGRAGDDCLRAYLKEALTPATEATNSINQQPVGYGFQFWLDTAAGSNKSEAVRMSGHQGQDIFMNMRTGKVVVVLGWRSNLRNTSLQPSSVSAWLVR